MADETPFKIVIDYELCEANQVCEGIAPDVFRVEEDDTLTLLAERPDPELYEDCRRAEQRCPRGAIKLVLLG